MFADFCPLDFNIDNESRATKLYCIMLLWEMSLFYEMTLNWILLKSYSEGKIGYKG